MKPALRTTNYPRAIPVTTSPTLKELFHIMDSNRLSQSIIEQRAGIEDSVIGRWRGGKHEPKLCFVELALEAMGYELRIVKRT